MKYTTAIACVAGLLLTACETPEDIAADYRGQNCTALLKESGALEYRLKDAETDQVVSTVALILTGDDDIALDSAFDDLTVNELEERLAILRRIRVEKGCP